MGDLRASVYDLLGYFLPGATTLMALMVVVNGGVFVDLRWFSSPASTALLIGACYVAGHLIQAAANSLPLLSDGPGSLMTRSDVVSAPLMKESRRALTDATGVDTHTLPHEETFALLDEYRVVAGTVGDRELFVYHEGFYRGMALASLLTASALLLRIVVPPVCAGDTTGAVHCLAASQRILACAGACIAVWAFYRRMLRFRGYRAQRAVSGVVLASRLRERKDK